jgi:hypothetical protein
MVTYKCNLCGKTFNHKSDYIKHTKRKNPCKSGKEHKIIEKKDPPNSTEIHQTPPISPKIIGKTKGKDNNEPMQNNSSSKHKCNFCQKIFSRSDSLNRHLSGRCKVKKQQDNEKESLLQRLVQQMERQNEEMVKMKEIINKLETENSKCTQKTEVQQNNTNNINTQNNIEKQQNNIQINNNIKLLAFGKEDMSHLVDEVYKKILNKGFKSVPTLV